MADFLGVPDDNKPPARRYPRMRAVIKANDHVQQARDHLRAHSEGRGSVTEEEVAKLERFIATNEGRIRKKLAYIAMLDLRLMLDKGRVDASRIGWLESTIETGLTTYANDLGKLDQLLEERKLDRTQHEALRIHVHEEADELRTEAIRLKEYIMD